MPPKDITSRLTVSAGKYITVGHNIMPGKKDTAYLPYTRLNEHLELLLYETMAWDVVFYDTSARRAWLVSGTTAVLHILSAYVRKFTGADVIVSPGIRDVLNQVKSGDTKDALSFLTRHRNAELSWRKDPES